MATAVSMPETIVDPDGEMPPWVLLVFADADERKAAEAAWESAGFNVETALNDEDAAGFLAVMTPALIVVDGAVYRPARR